MSYTVIVSENGRGRYQQEIVVGGRHRLLADEPEEAGGDNAGPSPFDFLLAGLGACTSMTVRMYAERKQWPLDRVSVALRFEKVESGGKKSDRVVLEITLEGNLSGEQRQRLHEIAGKCPTHRLLAHPLAIESHLLA